MKEFVIRPGELTLKGQNRSDFESRLIRNIRRLMKGTPCAIRRSNGRFYLEVEDEHFDLAAGALSRTFGIVGYSPTAKTEKHIESITASAIDIVREFGLPGARKTFKVRARRTDKSFPMDSHMIEVVVGDAVGNAFPELAVDLSAPDLLIQVEIREQAYVYVHNSIGQGGLPVGSAGRGTLLLSGGIDSPVAGYFMAKRGLKLDAIYFETYPYTSRDARNKVEALTRVLSPYNIGITLFIVPFTDISLRIREASYQSHTTLLMRACMMEIATRIARERNALAIVTGESLSQVASQTVESIRFTNAHAGLPVYRPLIGFDKQETISVARRIGTYDISKLPYEDCCTVFTPDAPTIKPNFERAEHEYTRLEAESLIAEATASAEYRWFEPTESLRM